jgi:hypothetical protein
LVGKISLVSRLPQYLSSALPEEAERIAYLMTAILTGAVEVASYTILSSGNRWSKQEKNGTTRNIGFQGE